MDHTGRANFYVPCNVDNLSERKTRKPLLDSLMSQQAAVDGNVSTNIPLPNTLLRFSSPPPYGFQRQTDNPGGQKFTWDTPEPGLSSNEYSTIGRSISTNNSYQAQTIVRSQSSLRTSSTSRDEHTPVSHIGMTAGGAVSHSGFMGGTPLAFHNFPFGNYSNTGTLSMEKNNILPSHIYNKSYIHGRSMEHMRYPTQHTVHQVTGLSSVQENLKMTVQPSLATVPLHAKATGNGPNLPTLPNSGGLLGNSADPKGQARLITTVIPVSSPQLPIKMNAAGQPGHLLMSAGIVSAADSGNYEYLHTQMSLPKSIVTQRANESSVVSTSSLKNNCKSEKIVNKDKLAMQLVKSSNTSSNLSIPIAEIPNSSNLVSSTPRIVGLGHQGIVSPIVNNVTPTSKSQTTGNGVLSSSAPGQPDFDKPSALTKVNLGPDVKKSGKMLRTLSYDKGNALPVSHNWADQYHNGFKMVGCDKYKARKRTLSYDSAVSKPDVPLARQRSYSSQPSYKPSEMPIECSQNTLPLSSQSRDNILNSNLQSKDTQADQGRNAFKLNYIDSATSISKELKDNTSTISTPVLHPKQEPYQTNRLSDDVKAGPKTKSVIVEPNAPLNLNKPLQKDLNLKPSGLHEKNSKSLVGDNSPTKSDYPACNCISGESTEAPYYTHLGAAESVQGIRKLFEKRMGYVGKAIRIEKVIYTGKEGRTSQGCPLAKWIIRRSGPEEKVLVVCRQRPGHRCANAVIVVIILLWDGVAGPLADFAYANIANYVPKHGEPTERRCATNEERTCACQGFDESTCGASFSFGCSWSMYYNGCKYARSHKPNKYKLVGTKDPEAEKFVGMICEKLATVMSPLYEMAAPDAFNNQVALENEGYECRLGEARKEKSRPFSGVTSCLDFCAHSHKDQHNMDNGSTVVLTFTKPELRHIGGKNMDEQLHVLPLCKLDLTNEEGTFEGVQEKISSGSVEILNRYHHEVRLRSTPKLSKKQKSRAKKKELASTDSPSCKRKGRPPKRSRSFENLLQTDKMMRTIGRMEPPVCSNSPFHRQDFQPKAEYFLPPDMTSPNTPHSLPDHLKCYPHPTQMGFPEYSKVDQPVPGSNQAQSPNDNLPPINGFFVGEQQNQPQDSPSKKIQGGWNPQMKTPPSHLPSIQNVITSPFGPNTPDHCVNSPGTPRSGLSMMSSGVTTDMEGCASPCTPHNRFFGSPLHTQPYGNTPTNAMQEPATPGETILYSDCEESFRDSEIGGVAVAPGHGSVLIECAKKELHATTALRSPNRFYPSRISLVFYQHKSMNYRNHGAAEYEAKEEERRKQREKEKKVEAALTQPMMDPRIPSSPMLVPETSMSMYDALNKRPSVLVKSEYHGQVPNSEFERGLPMSFNHQMEMKKANVSVPPCDMAWQQRMFQNSNHGYSMAYSINPTYISQPTLIPHPNLPQYVRHTMANVPTVGGTPSMNGRPLPHGGSVPSGFCYRSPTAHNLIPQNLSYPMPVGEGHAPPHSKMVGQHAENVHLASQNSHMMGFRSSHGMHMSIAQSPALLPQANASMCTQQDGSNPRN